MNASQWVVVELYRVGRSDALSYGSCRYYEFWGEQCRIYCRGYRDGMTLRKAGWGR